MDDLQASPLNKKISQEVISLAPFAAIAKKHLKTYFVKQILNNRISLEGNVYFQFGDLRVDTNTKHIVIETESGGGVTNLVKYWYCLNRNLIQKPVILLHLFQVNSKKDYASHIILWSFINRRIKNDLADRFTGHVYTYRPQHIQDDLREALQLFENLITA